MPIRRGRNAPVTLTLSEFSRMFDFNKDCEPACELLTHFKTRDTTASKKTNKCANIQYYSQLTQ